MWKQIAVLCASATLWLGSASAQNVPVVEAEVWAQLDRVTAVDMSPDGENIAMLMRREVGARPEIVLFESGAPTDSMQALETELEPTSLFWANDRYLVVSFVLETEWRNQEVFLGRVASYDTRRGRWQSMVGVPGSTSRNRMDNAMAVLGSAGVQSRLVGDPEHILIAHTEEFGTSPTYYRTNVTNGSRQEVYGGSTRFGGLVFDAEGQARGATEYDAARNRVVVFARPESGAEWQEIGALNSDERLRFNLLGFHDENPNIATVVADSEDSNYQSVFALNMRTGAREMMFGAEGVDATGVVTSPIASEAGRIIGFSYSDAEGSKRYFVDEGLGQLYTSLEGAFPGDQVFIIRVSEDMNTTLFYVTGPRNSGAWYMLRNGRASELIRRNPDIPTEALSPMEVLEYTGRDGRELSGYVTIPAGDGPFPAIAMPHGGPWVRDSRGYDEWAQMLANRGYVVFQPNYRGSTGLGREHWIAGDGQWGLTMQDDVDDGMLALVDQGIADRERLGFFGWSYGGYSAFVAATQEDPIYNCSAAGAGLTDLTRVRGGLAGNPYLRRFQRPTIDGVSPLTRVDQLAMPMLVIHGDRDRTAPVDHSRWFVDAVEEGADLEYIEVEGMLHSPRGFGEYMAFYPDLLEFFETKCQF